MKCRQQTSMLDCPNCLLYRLCRVEKEGVQVPNASFDSIGVWTFIIYKYLLLYISGIWDRQWYHRNVVFLSRLDASPYQMPLIYHKCFYSFDKEPWLTIWMCPTFPLPHWHLLISFLRASNSRVTADSNLDLERLYSINNPIIVFYRLSSNDLPLVAVCLVPSIRSPWQNYKKK